MAVTRCNLFRFCLAACTLAAWTHLPAADESAEPAVTASGAILVDVDSGVVLWSRDPDRRLYPASTTKILTAALALRRGRLSDRVTASARAAETGASSLWLTEGESLTLGQLVTGILLRSANDACVAVAEHISGSVESFVALMNATCREVGATHTHFTNPHGLHDPDHYTTPRDLARLTRWALAIPRFRQIVGMREAVIPWAGHPWDRRLVNRNRLLHRRDDVDGVKTGYTRKAGRCLVATATHDGWQLLAVALHSEDANGDCSRLLDYGFAHFERRKIARRGQMMGETFVIDGREPRCQVRAADDVVIVAPRAGAQAVRLETQLWPVTAPLHRGDQVGALIARWDGQILARSPCVAATDVALSNWAKLRGELQRRRQPLLLLLALVVIYGAIAQVSRRRRRVLQAHGREVDRQRSGDR